MLNYITQVQAILQSEEGAGFAPVGCKRSFSVFLCRFLTSSVVMSPLDTDASLDVPPQAPYPRVTASCALMDLVSPVISDTPALGENVTL